MVVSARARRWAAILLAAYLALAVLALLAPRPIDLGFTPWLRWLIAFAQQHGLPGWLDYDVVEYTAHVVLLVPIGILSVVAIGRRLAWLALMAAVGLGAALEYGTSVAHGDDGASGLDLWLNALGVLLGALTGWWALEPGRVSSVKTR